jgi:hypothetical protein
MMIGYFDFRPALAPAAADSVKPSAPPPSALPRK